MPFHITRTAVERFQRQFRRWCSEQECHEELRRILQYAYDSGDTARDGLHIFKSDLLKQALLFVNTVPALYAVVTVHALPLSGWCEAPLEIAPHVIEQSARVYGISQQESEHALRRHLPGARVLCLHEGGGLVAHVRPFDRSVYYVSPAMNKVTEYRTAYWTREGGHG